MKLGVSTSNHGRLLRRPEVYFTCEEALRVCKGGGFNVINLDLIEYSKPGQPMRNDDWESWIHQQRELADDLELEVTYGHAPFYDWYCAEPDGSELYEELIRRSIIAAGIMGVKQLVFHPGTIVDADWYDYKKLMDLNQRFFISYSEQCGGYGIKTVIENMMEPDKKRKFGSSLEELLTLYESLKDKGDFGICWDFGHGHLSGLEQRAAMLEMGNRLTMLHVSDNFGIKDDHLAPYFGTIDWDNMMKTLAEIRYKGDFIFENFSFFDGAPAELRIPIMQLCKSIGDHLCNKFDAYVSVQEE